MNALSFILLFFVRCVEIFIVAVAGLGPIALRLCTVHVAARKSSGLGLELFVHAVLTSRFLVGSTLGVFVVGADRQVRTILQLGGGCLLQ